MLLTEAQVKKYQAVYKAHCGEEISLKEATIQAQQLVNFVRVVYDEMRRPEIRAILQRILEEEERVEREEIKADDKAKLG